MIFLLLTLMLCTTIYNNALETTRFLADSLCFPWNYIEHRIDNISDSIIDIVWDSIDIYLDNIWDSIELSWDNWDNAWDSINDNSIDYQSKAWQAYYDDQFIAGRLMNTLYYIDENTVSKILESLLQQEIPITKDELLQLFMFSDEKQSSQYLLEAIRNGKASYFDIDYFSTLLPYLDESCYENILFSISDKINFELIDTWKCYLDEKTLEQCLLKFIEDGNTLTYAQFYRISPYLSQSTIQKIDNLLK